MKSRKLIIGLLVMLAFVVSSFTYAYWSINSLAAEQLNNNITIGTGRRQEVTLALTGPAVNATLVPSGQIGNSLGANPVESLTFTFTVRWVDNGENNGFTGRTLTTTISNLTGNATAEGLLTFTINTAEVLTATQAISEGAANSVTVTIVVTLDSGASAVDYASIFGAALTFDVAFVVTTVLF